VLEQRLPGRQAHVGSAAASASSTVRGAAASTSAGAATYSAAAPADGVVYSRSGLTSHAGLLEKVGLTQANRQRLI
jgi:hypothetical protein